MAKSLSAGFPWAPRRRPYQRVYQPIGGPSLTQQEFRDQCDINHQLQLFVRSGRPLPVYALDASEFSPDEVQDVNATYVDAYEAVQRVNDAFEELPSRVRTRFGNSPLKMAQFLADPANRQEAFDLGLVLTPPPEPSPAEPKGAQRPSEAPKGADAPADAGASK